MTTPIADEVVRLADGRLLAWAEWGDPRGSPVVFLHCSPGSRILCPDPGGDRRRRCAPHHHRPARLRPIRAGRQPDADRVRRGRPAPDRPPVARPGPDGGMVRGRSLRRRLRRRPRRASQGAGPAGHPGARPRGPVARAGRSGTWPSWPAPTPNGPSRAATEAGATLAAAPEHAGDSWQSAADRAIRARGDTEDALRSHVARGLPGRALTASPPTWWPAPAPGASPVRT